MSQKHLFRVAVEEIKRRLAENDAKHEYLLRKEAEQYILENRVPTLEWLLEQLNNLPEDMASYSSHWQCGYNMCLDRVRELLEQSKTITHHENFTTSR